MDPPEPPPGGGAAPPAGWYLDPSAPALLRYWDGATWTQHTAPRSMPPLGAAAPLPNPASLVAPDGRPFASFWRRFFGLFIDGFILAIPTGILLFAVLSPVFTKFANEISVLPPNATQAEINQVANDFTASLPVGAFIGVALINAGIGLLYYGICLHVWGRTIGGQLVGIRCINEHGENPTWRESFTREGVVVGFNLVGAVPWLGVVGSVLLLVNYLSMIWHPKKQCWMDRAAGTFVVKA